MQTFLAYRDFAQAAKVLDDKRLGKQRVENLQILKALLDPKYGWQNHPAVKMWRGHELMLMGYHAAIVTEWLTRGYNDTTFTKVRQLVDGKDLGYRSPSWLSDERIFKTHRSNLLSKDPVHYGQFGWTEPHNLCYFWPV